MTDTASPEELTSRPKWDPASDPDGYTRDQVTPKDGYLDVLMSVLVGMDDNREGSISLTIQTGGHTISGELISRAEWITLFADQLAKIDEAHGEALRGAYSSLHDQAVQELDRRHDRELPSSSRRFIHMKDARVFSGGLPEGVRVGVWRGALEDVAGWSLGSLRTV